MLVFEKDSLLFVFNFHPEKSYEDYLIPSERKGRVAVVLDTDRVDFGGHSRNGCREYRTEGNAWQGRHNSFKLYLPSRSALVFEIKE